MPLTKSSLSPLSLCLCSWGSIIWIGGGAIAWKQVESVAELTADAGAGLGVAEWVKI